MSGKPQITPMSMSREQIVSELDCIERFRGTGNAPFVDYRRLAEAYIKLLDTQAKEKEEAVAGERAGTEEWWDQNSVQCQNCSVQLVARGGTLTQHGKTMLPTNFGLSHEEGEEEALCGYCAGEELHRLIEERDAERERCAKIGAPKTDGGAK